MKQILFAPLHISTVPRNEMKFTGKKFKVLIAIHIKFFCKYFCQCSSNVAEFSDRQLYFFFHLHTEVSHSISFL